MIDKDILTSIPELTSVMEKEHSVEAHSSTDCNSVNNRKDPFDECRACLQRTDNKSSYNLFEAWYTPWAVRGALIADDLSKFADVEISESDKFSKVICLTCYRRLSDACTFMITVQMSDSILRQRVDKSASEAGTSWPQPILLSKNGNGDVDTRIQVEVKQEVLSEDENGVDMNQDWEPTMDIKIEPEEISAPVQYNAETNGEIDKVREETTNSNDSNTKHDLENVLDDTIKQEPPSGDELLEVSPDLPLDCMLCFKVFNTISGLKAHVISQHSYKSVKRKAVSCPSPVKNKIQVKQYPCNLCDKSFTTSTDLMVHRASHSEHVCYVCDRKFNTFQQLMRHGPRCQKKHASAARRDHTRLPSKPQQKPAKTKTNAKQLKIGELCTKSESPVIDESVTEQVQELVKSLPSADEMDIKSSQTHSEISVLESKKQDDLVHEQRNTEVIELKIVKNENRLLTEIKEEPMKIKIESPFEEIHESVQESKSWQPKLQIGLSVQNQSKNLLSECEIEDNSRLPEVKFEDDTMEQEQKFQIEPSNEEVTVTIEGILSESMSESEADEGLSQKPNSSLENSFTEILLLKISSPKSINCNSLPNKNEDQLHLKTFSETVDSLLIDPACPSLSKEDNPDETFTNIANVNNEEFKIESHSMTEEVEPCIEQKICLENFENDNSDVREGNLSTIDEVSEMKVHLAINPLDKDTLLFETEVENIECDKSDSCEPKLVSVISDQNDIKHSK